MMKFFKRNNNLKIIGTVVFSVIFTTGCWQPEKDLYKDEIDSIGIVWVPDLREGIFEAELLSDGTDLILKGETNVPEAKEGIVNFMEQKKVIFIDSLLVLPDTSAVKDQWGLVDVSVCNIRLFSSFEAEMVSQATMGTPVKILKKEGDWYLVQTPDMYLGWVDIEAIESKSNGEFAQWKSSSRLFYIGKTGDIYADQSGSKVISDIVAGCIVEVTDIQEDIYMVKLPDGRKGFIPREKVILLDQLLADTYLNRENLVATAESFMGIPYLWGGTSSKGFDCSGFVKTVYFLNGLILSRDASQQFQNGIRIRRAGFPDSLRNGDLLFFGSSRHGRPWATHVGMYIGDTEFIHASGMVKINSLDSTRANFSRFRRDSFIGVRRIIGADYGHGIQPVSTHSWYH